jgi:hypothetical protein
MSLTGGSKATTVVSKSSMVKVAGGFIPLNEMTTGDTVAVRLLPDPTAAGFYELNDITDLNVRYSNPLEGTITYSNGKKLTVTLALPEGGSVTSTLSWRVPIWKADGSKGSFGWLTRGKPVAIRGFFNQRTHRMFGVTNVQILRPLSLSWAKPQPIVYGTDLSAIQLRAKANAPGSFTYSPPAGTDLGTGSQTLTATFQPTDTIHYLSGSQVRTTITVTQATPHLSWMAPSPITYGTPLSDSQLNATADVPGTFTYDKIPGTILGAGNQKLSATFTPSDTMDYIPGGRVQATLTVNQATPALSWLAPDPITYGTGLSAIQLNASASVPGTFTYSPAAGTVLGAGSHMLTATFTPSNAVDYASGTQVETTLTVNQATPDLTWKTPDAITYGTALSETQLNAGSSVPGRFAYSPALGTILGAGTQTLTATFTPTDTTDYVSGGSVQTSLVVNQAAPVVTWNTPSPITVGTPLSDTQLDATANVAGAFSYTPPAETFLSPGDHVLSVTFTPTDTVDYGTGQGAVVLTVTK